MVESTLSSLDDLFHLIVYRPLLVNKNCLLSIFEYLRPLIVDCQRYIFSGDLNLNVSVPVNAQFILDLLSSHELSRIEFGLFTSTSSTEIDIIAFGGALQLIEFI